MSARWPMATVDKLLRLRLDVPIPRAESAASQRARFIDLARSDAGVAVEAQDIHLNLASTGDSDIAVWRADWCPDVQMVEVVGGMHDGAAYPVLEVGRVLVLQQPRPPISLADVETALAQPSPPSHRYYLNGWNPHARRWVYSPRDTGARP